jgi:hypothetical protein
MRVRTFTGYLPLFVESDINHWLEVCPDVRIQHLHYQDNGERCSVLVEYIILKKGEYNV